jgi:hypothetical protein
MRWSDLPLDPSRTTLRQFGVMGVVILGGLAAWRIATHGPSPGSIALGVFGLVLGVIGVLAPQHLKPIFVGWTVLAFPIGWLVSQVVMALLYYGVLTPIGLALRATGRDALALKKSEGTASYWVPKPAPADVRSYFRQY